MSRAALIALMLCAGCFDFSRFEERARDLGASTPQDSGLPACGTMPPSAGNLLAPDSDQFQDGEGGWTQPPLQTTLGDTTMGACIYPSSLKVCGEPSGDMGGLKAVTVYFTYHFQKPTSYAFGGWVSLSHPSTTVASATIVYCGADGAESVVYGTQTTDANGWQAITATGYDLSPCPGYGPGMELWFTIAPSDGAAFLAPDDCVYVNYASLEELD